MNEGHGHVFPRPDGIMARCGGPGICEVCNLEYTSKRIAEREKIMTDAKQKSVLPRIGMFWDGECLSNKKLSYLDEEIEYLSLQEHESALNEAVRKARAEGVIIQREIENAKRALKNGDPGLAAFCLRDLSISKELGIDGLFACLASENGFPHENDVNPLIERILRAVWEEGKE